MKFNEENKEEIYKRLNALEKQVENINQSLRSETSIKIDDQKSQKSLGKNPNEKVSFGFYSSLLVFIVIIISFSRILYFFQEFIIQQIPITKFYLDYFFENIRNLFEIFKNLFSNY